MRSTLFATFATHFISILYFFAFLLNNVHTHNFHYCCFKTTTWWRFGWRLYFIYCAVCLLMLRSLVLVFFLLSSQFPLINFSRIFKIFNIISNLIFGLAANVSSLTLLNWALKNDTIVCCWSGGRCTFLFNINGNGNT